jgi:membrane fusion protein, multidrug efflux system
MIHSYTSVAHTRGPWMPKSLRDMSLASACRAAVFLWLALLLAGCGNAPNPEAASKGGPGAGKKGGRGGMSMTIPVAVAKAEMRDLPVYLSGLGSVDAFNTVVVKSRIDGQLVEIKFREGQDVNKGDLLAVIDPRPYEVALSQAEATLYKDQSALKDAKLNMQRFQDLYKSGVISQQQYDTQTSTVGQLEGAVRADQAQVDNVKLNLIYTRITAPVSGRVGLKQVDVGNMVHAADPNGLVVITQLQPIAVVFSLPEDNLPTVSHQMKKGQLQVLAFSRDDQTQLAKGTLLTIDNQIDPQTGTGKLKAIFDNHERALWPNQFVNARLLLEVRKNNIVVPAAAIQRGPQGTYVYTVKADRTAEMRPVTVAFSEGNFTSIAQGVTPGDTVVIDGQDKLQPGTPVDIRGGGPSDGGNGPGRRPAQAATPGQ